MLETCSIYIYIYISGMWGSHQALILVTPGFASPFLWSNESLSGVPGVPFFGPPVGFPGTGLFVGGRWHHFLSGCSRPYALPRGHRARWFQWRCKAMQSTLWITLILKAICIYIYVYIYMYMCIYTYVWYIYIYTIYIYDIFFGNIFTILFV